MTHSAAKQTLVLVPVARRDVETGDIASVLGHLKSLIGDRSSALSAEGSLAVTFSDYDRDPRPLVMIPEVRHWFAKLHSAWPYWSFFSSRTLDTTGVLLSLLLPGRMVPGQLPGEVGWVFDYAALSPLLGQLLRAQNQLAERLDISEAENARITNEFLDSVRAFIEDVPPEASGPGAAPRL